jgi:pSer/pThr/pTyr-binding forkhead associated (FHA) protein
MSDQDKQNPEQEDIKPPSDLDTKRLQDQQQPHDPYSTQIFEATDVVPTNAVELGEAAIPDRLRIIMPDASVLVFDEFTPHLVIGRKTRTGTVNIDIDLMAYDAGVTGVSRVHAMIAPDASGMTIKDLNSVNGTFLNGQQLQSSRPYPLRSNDRIKCGNLKIEVIFESMENK